MQENEITSKRDYSKYHYIVLQLRKANNESQAIGNVNSIAENEIDICQKVANSISGGILVDSGVGKVLDDHCVVAIEKHSTNPQIPSHVLQKRTILEGNYHDDSLEICVEVSKKRKGQQDDSGDQEIVPTKPEVFHYCIYFHNILLDST